MNLRGLALVTWPPPILFGRGQPLLSLARREHRREWRTLASGKPNGRSSEAVEVNWIHALSPKLLVERLTEAAPVGRSIDLDGVRVRLATALIPSPDAIALR